MKAFRFRALSAQVGNTLAGRWGKACFAALLFLAPSAAAVAAEWAAARYFSLPMLTDRAGTPAIVLDDVPNSSAAALALVTAASLFALFVLWPLRLGAAAWYCRLADGQSPDTSCVFAFFRGDMYIKALSLWLAITLRYTFWAAVFMPLPIAALMLSYSHFAVQTGTARLFAAAAFLSSLALAAMSAFLCWCWCRRYALCTAVLARSPHLTVKSAVRRSVFAMRGHSGELVLLRARLLPYSAAGFLLLTMPFVFSFRMTAYGLFAKERLG